MASKSHPLAPESDSDTDFEYELPSVISSFYRTAPLNESDESSQDFILICENSTPNLSKTKFLYPADDTIDILRPEQVRWFYKQDGQKKWTPFIGYDSLRIECKYREVKNSQNKTNMKNENEDERICVRGSIYEVSVRDMMCYPIYWHRKGESAKIMRATWFLESSWDPLKEHIADEVEREHLVKFKNQLINETPIQENGKGPLPVLHSLKFDECYLEWNANSYVTLHYQSTTSKLYRAVGKHFGITNNGTRVHRGYCYEASIEDKVADIGHLVFVVHGIGQKMDTGNIAARCADLRNMCQKAKEKYMSDTDVDIPKRAEFLPVEWRSSLKLDGDIVESITPAHMMRIRGVLNSSAMDIMYYTSPLYRTEITNGLQQELNRLYSMFCQRMPHFEASNGKVSIVAHSLGSVIMYDIITGWNPIQLYDRYVSGVIQDATNPPGNKSTERSDKNKNTTEATCAELGETGNAILEELEGARQKVTDLEKKLFGLAEKQHMNTPSLKFKVTNFFCVGSPLAVFLAMRGIRPSGSGTLDHIVPKELCSRLFNIYHPYDPVAYRLEPLILKSYDTITPIKIFRHDSTKKVPYDSIPPMACGKKLAKKDRDKIVPLETEAEQNNNTSKRKSGSTEKRSSSGGWGSLFRRKEKGKVVSEMSPMSSTASSPSDSPAKGVIRYTPASRDSSDFDGESSYSDRMSPESAEVKLFTGSIAKRPETHGFTVFDKPDHTELEHRLDYQIHEGKMENVYISAVTSHTSYWTNQDVALFILQHLFPGVEVT